MPANRSDRTRYSNWILTTWDPEAPYLKENWWEPQMDNLVQYVTVGHEHCHEGEQREHWHIYFELSGNHRKNMASIKEWLNDLTVHCEVRRGTGQQAIKYCQKGFDFWELGEPKRQGSRSDLVNCKQLLEEGVSMIELAQAHFGDFVRYYRGLYQYADLLSREKQRTAGLSEVEVTVFIGPAGSGKTYNCSKIKAEYEENGMGCYQFMQQQNGKCYFDGYEKQKCIWFDEFTGSTMQFNHWCRLADKYGVRVETKGGSVQISGLKRIIISTIIPPGEWWPNSQSFRDDPEQLWRRITEIYYCPKSTGTRRNKTYYKPMLIPEEDWERICRPYLENLDTLKVPIDD
uniref:Replication-associated protein n=1 Tax=Dromedary stool-associated circular ssDNA virus TaxID=1574422 RepID=A0A0A1ENT7_9VIRU|nr:putative replicase protein [Dromedary stool-associated circular ssDNA virus]